MTTTQPAAPPPAAPADDRLVWLDLEMTGLEVDTDVIVVDFGPRQRLKRGAHFALHGMLRSRVAAWVKAHLAGGAEKTRVLA